MSYHQDNHQDQTAMALAALTVCIVQTLDESNPAFRPTFDKHLEVMYYKFRDSGQNHLAVLETLSYVRDLLKKS